MTIPDNLRTILSLVPEHSQSRVLELLYEIRKADKADGFRRGLEAGLSGGRSSADLAKSLVEQATGMPIVRACGEEILEAR